MNTNFFKRILKANISLSLLLILAIIGAIIFALFPPLVLEQMVNRFTSGESVGFAIAFCYLGMIAVSGIFDAIKEILITRFGQKITHQLRSDMYHKLSKLPAAYYNSHESGVITSRLVNDADAVDSLFTNGIISMIVDSCKVLSIIAVIFIKSTGLGILMILTTPILFILTRCIQKKMLSAQLKNRIAISKVNNHVPESIKNIRMIHSLSREKYMENRYDDYIQESYKAVDRSNFYDAIYSPIIVFISSCVIAAMMIMSAKSGKMQTFFGMSVGTAVAIIAYVDKVFTPLESIGMEIQNIQSAIAGVKRINEFLLEQEIKPTNFSITSQALIENIDKYPECVISFNNVDFEYEKDITILKQLSFNIKKGEIVTLIGRTGAGKSTIFKIIMGLYSPQNGSVLIANTPADSIPNSQKRNIFGYVEQSFSKINGTVAEQISLYDSLITQEQIEKAAILVGLHDYILTLENGYDTYIRDGLFSQGQLQLLSIARALVTNPPILLLDEITANLDSDTENQVINAILAASCNRTVISISHRIYEKTTLGTIIEI